MAGTFPRVRFSESLSSVKWPQGPQGSLSHSCLPVTLVWCSSPRGTCTYSFISNYKRKCLTHYPRKTRCEESSSLSRPLKHSRCLSLGRSWYRRRSAEKGRQSKREGEADRQECGNRAARKVKEMLVSEAPDPLSVLLGWK